MKLTKENEKILRKLGFTPDSDTQKDMEDWWSLSNGWGFRLDAIHNFKDLVKRLMLAKYEEPDLKI